MNVLSLEGENFLTLEKFYVEMKNRGLVLIQGQNKADSSAESNGAGKSSIPDALSWCAYGITARGVTGDTVINTVAKKNAHIRVKIEDDNGDIYVIDRYRKHDDFKNVVRVKVEKADGTEADLTKGTDKETQLVINQIIGCSSDVFNAAVYSGQECMPNLPGMTDKQLKTLLEEAAGTEELAECYALARKKALAASKDVDVATAELKTLDETKLRFATMLTDSNKSRDEFDSTRSDRARAVLAAVLPINSEIATLKAELETLPKASDLLSERATIEARLSAVEGEKVALNEAQTAFNEASKLLARADSQLTLSGSQARSAKEALTNVDSRVGTPCSECGKPYCEEDIAKARVLAQEALDKAIRKLSDDNMERKVCAAKAAELSDELAKIKASMTDVSAEVKMLGEINEKMRGIQAIQSKIESLENKVAAIKKEAAGVMTEVNPYLATVEKISKGMEDVKRNITDKQATLEELQAKAQLAEDAAQVFGPAGVRAHILDLITPFLNDRTRDYLGALSDGNIHAIWSTLSKTAKGELREKFNIEVWSDTGGDSFAALSGGEKRKVRLATAMALQEMVASRAAKPIGLFIADEIDDSVDGAGLERLMGILEKRARDSGSLFVISHNEMADWVDQVITVVKDGKQSVVTGATHSTM